MVRIWKPSSAWGASSRRPTCQVSARAPASSQAAAVSSSQLVPGARRTITRGVAMVLMVGSTWGGETHQSMIDKKCIGGFPHTTERSETAVAGVEARLVIGLGAVGQVATDQLGLVNLNHEIGRDLEPRRRALGGEVGRGTAAKLGHADVLGPALDVVDAGDAVGVAGYE